MPIRSRPGPIGVGAVLTEDADAGPDEARIAVVGADVPALESPRPEVLADDVGAGRQPAEQVLALGAAQVDGDPLAPSALDRPPHRVVLAVGAGGEGADGAHEVAPDGVLDLDDLGAHLAEQAGAEGRPDASADVDDPQPGERSDRRRRALRWPGPARSTRPREVGGAAVLEGGHALGHLGGGGGHGLGLPLALEGGGERRLEGGVEERLGQAERSCGPGGHPGGELLRGAVELFDGGQAAVGQAEVDRFGAHRPLAQHDHGLGSGQAHQAGEEVGTAGIDHQSPAGERPDELGLLAGEHEVTGEGQVRAGADGGAVDGSHGRLVELPELSDEGLDPDPERLARGPGVEPFAAGAAHGGLAEVHAGAERVAHPGDEEGPHVVVGAGLAHAGEDVVAHLDAQGVLGFGPVEGEVGDMVLADLVADHSVSVLTHLRRSPRPARRCSRPPLRSRPGGRRTKKAMSTPVVSLEEAVASHVQPGDAVHVVTGHTRWTAAAREVIRQWWGRDPGFTLVMLSLSSLGAVFFRGGLLSKVVTGYSGDVFPNFTPNRWFGEAYLSGAVEVEHWSFLTFLQRLEAAARGLPAIATTSLQGSSMAENPGFAVVDSPFGGRLGLLEPYAPDVALLHAPLADTDGNVAMSPPLLEGVWGALAARRGAIVTCERVVDDIRPWSHLVRIPAHRVLAVSEVPMGAHPGGLYVPHLPVEPYGEDLEFWQEVRDASRGDGFDAFIERWVLGPPNQQVYLEQLGPARLARLRRRAEPDSWRDDEAAHPPDLEAPVGAWERATVFGARYVADRVIEGAYDAVLAGAGVANLCAWLAVHTARERGSEVVLTAELGLWGYEPTPADPFVFNHRSFPSAIMVSDSETVLSTFVAGPGTRLLGCLGAAQIDRSGNINSTVIPDKAFLVGSGGGNDVASAADEVVVVATLAPRRTVEEVPYVTSPGDRVRALVTDLGTFERRHGRFVLTAVPAGPGTIVDRVESARSRCGWELECAEELTETPGPTPEEVEALRRWDPEQRFLRPDAEP